MVLLLTIRFVCEIESRSAYGNSVEEVVLRHFLLGRVNVVPYSLDKNTIILRVV